MGGLSGLWNAASGSEAGDVGVPSAEKQGVACRVCSVRLRRSLRAGRLLQLLGGGRGEIRCVWRGAVDRRGCKCHSTRQVGPETSNVSAALCQRLPCVFSVRQTICDWQTADRIRATANREPVRIGKFPSTLPKIPQNPSNSIAAFPAPRRPPTRLPRLTRRPPDLGAFFPDRHATNVKLAANTNFSHHRMRSGALHGPSMAPPWPLHSRHQPCPMPALPCLHVPMAHVTAACPISQASAGNWQVGRGLLPAANKRLA